MGNDVVQDLIKSEDDQFLGDLKGKEPEFVLEFFWQAKGRAGLGAYQMLQSLRYFETTGNFNKVGFASFEHCLSISPFSGPQYHSWLRAAYKFSKEIIEKVGFPVLSSIIQKQLPEKSQQIIIETVEREIEERGTPPPTQKVKELIAKLRTPVDFREQKEGKIRQFRIMISALKKRVKELETENRDLREENESLKVRLEEERRYREDIQKGKRPM